MIIIKDNFLENIDQIRTDALSRYSKERKISAKNYPGIKIHVPENTKKIIEKKAQNILNENVTCGEMCYQFVDKTYVKGIPHIDPGYKYTLMVYLNPTPLQSGGTEIFEHYYDHCVKEVFYNSNIVLSIKEKFFSKTKRNFFDKLIYKMLVKKVILDQNYSTSVSNKYNRLLIFNSNMVHRAENYFGTGKNSRLSIVGFFK